jgi:hypothetical protein
MNRTLLVFVLAVAGCGRAHLEPGYGRSYHAQFSQQVASPAAPRKVTSGLDPQEAAIIASTYRRSLAPKEEHDVKDQPILVVTPQQRGMAPGLPPPSVPKE